MQAAPSVFCGGCGFPGEDAVCAACGRSRETPVQEHPPKRSGRVLAPSPTDFPALATAFAAWGQRDFPRMVSHCLESAGIRIPQPETLPRGLGWMFFQHSAAVFISLSRDGELAVESPLVLVPSEQRVALFRALLELNEASLGAARFCLRVDKVILRFVDRVENIAPPKLMEAIREVALAADHFDDLLAHRFSAPMLGPEVKKHKTPWQLLGPPVVLKIDVDAPPARFELESLSDHVAGASGRSFLPPVDDAEELELARPVRSAASEEEAGPLAMLGQAQQIAERHLEEGVLGLLVLRAAAYKARALFRVEHQPQASWLLRGLGAWLGALPEVPSGGLFAKLKLQGGPGRPSFSEVNGVLADILDNSAVIGPEWNGVYPIPAFTSPEDARQHVRKLVAAVAGAANDDELRGLVLEGALCEMLLRCNAKNDVVDAVLTTVCQASRPGPMRVQQLQKLLTRLFT